MLPRGTRLEASAIAARPVPFTSRLVAALWPPGPGELRELDPRSAILLPHQLQACYGMEKDVAACREVDTMKQLAGFGII